MDESMNDETLAKIEAICEKVSVAHSLDPEIREELRGHMEDKLFAYLDGREQLSEEDALILVQEHFGDPARVKSLLQDVHVVETQVSLARRIAAISCLYLGFAAAMSILLAVMTSLLAWYQFRHPDYRSIEYLNVYFALLYTSILAGTFIQWRILLGWERGIRDGKMPWFQRWRARDIIFLICFLPLLVILIPVSPNVFQNHVLLRTPLPPQELWIISFGTVIIGLMLQGFLWLWWCDRPPKLPRTLIVAAMAWLAVSSFPFQSLQVVQLEIYSYNPTGFTPDLSNRLVLWEEQSEAGYGGVWALRVGHIQLNDLQGLIVQLIVSLAYGLPIVGFAWFLYRRFERRREAPDKKEPASFA